MTAKTNTHNVQALRNLTSETQSGTASDKFATYQLLTHEFTRRGYKTHLVRLGAIETITFESPAQKSWITNTRKIAYPINSAFISHISTHKHIGYEFAAQQDAPIPQTILVAPSDDVAEVVNTFTEPGSYYIVKPDNASLSNGLTRNVTTLPEFHKAIAYARQYGEFSLIQGQVTGDEVRFVVLDGEIKAALVRQTPRVIGDGHSSISQLIDLENDERDKISGSMVTYPRLSKSIITPSFMNSDTVPEIGEVIELSASTMISGGASVYNVINQVHQSYSDIVAKLVHRLGAGFIVVDMFIIDYTQPATDTNVNFIEFNTAPVLKLFYSCRDGKNVDIVPQLVDAIDRRLCA